MFSFFPRALTFKSQHILVLEKPTFTKTFQVCFELTLFYFCFFPMQDFKFEGKELNQHIPMSCLKANKIFEK